MLLSQGRICNKVFIALTGHKGERPREGRGIWTTFFPGLDTLRPLDD